jgi:hypothetical protein
VVISRSFISAPSISIRQLFAKRVGLLRRRVQPLVSKTPNSRPYAEIAGEVAGAVAAMDWLVAYGCSCDAEALAWETMADAYCDPNFDIVRLREIRDPKNLGRALREHPARFSMLTSNSHLKAWLSFADDKSLREQALAGARKLDHRTSDAVEMLGEDEYTAGALLEYLPILDLDATAPLCKAAKNALHRHLPRFIDLTPMIIDHIGNCFHGWEATRNSPH